MSMQNILINQNVVRSKQVTDKDIAKNTYCSIVVNK